jgi:hypothetical protein
LRSRRFDGAKARRGNQDAENSEIQIELWSLERYSPRANNPRTHTREQIASIAASIQEFGWTNPVLVGAGNQLAIAGAGWDEAMLRFRIGDTAGRGLRHKPHWLR